MRHSSDSPVVSVVVPCFNPGRLLRPTLESIFGQDYPNIECIVVDAGSTDGTQQILESYGDRLRWISRKDRGPYDAINDGWAMSRGEVIAWLNADDTWTTPSAVTFAVNYLNGHPDVDVVYGDCGGIDLNDRLVWYGPAPEWNFETALVTCDPLINQAASFMRRDAVEKAGWLYPEWCHDHDLWLRMALSGAKLAAVRTYLGNARISSENAHMNPSLTVPNKVGLTKRILDDPRLSPELRGRRRRIISNAYVRCLDFLPKPAHWPIGIRLVLQALASSPTNAPH